MAFCPRCLMNSYGISSSPEALLFLESLMVRSISAIVNAFSLSSDAPLHFILLRFFRLSFLSSFRTGSLEKPLYVLANSLALSPSSTYHVPSTSRTSLSLLGGRLPSIFLMVFQIWVELVVAVMPSTYSFHMAFFLSTISSEVFLHAVIHSSLLCPFFSSTRFCS